MAYFGDKRIGLMGPDKTVPPDETLDGRPYKYNPKNPMTNTTYGLGEGYFAVSGSLNPRFDVQAAVDELVAKVTRGQSSRGKAANVAESDSQKSSG